MARSAKLTVFGALALVLGGCKVSIDLVASGDYDASVDRSSDSPYGDFDPNNPPVVREIQGDISPVTDPSLFLWEDTYYVFSSGPGISVRSSKDLINFKLEPQVFAQNPAWIAEKIVAFKVGDLWSPHVLTWDNKTIHLYYAASTFSTDCACIGHATATSLGPGQAFVDDQSPVICSNLSSSCLDSNLKDTGPDNFTAIDPAVMADESGNLWMVFGSFGSGIQMIQLDPKNGRRLDPHSTPVVVAARPSRAIQAASLYHGKDYYYLFVSFDGSPNHLLRVGRSRTVTGPYLDSEGMDMREGGGRPVFAADSNAYFKGGGSNVIFDDGNQRWNVYHAYDAVQKSPPSTLRISPLVFDSNGWPVSAGP